MDMHQTMTVEAEPYPLEFVPAHCALLIIDMQRDFREAGVLAPSKLLAAAASGSHQTPSDSKARSRASTNSLSE